MTSPTDDTPATTGPKPVPDDPPQGEIPGTEGTIHKIPRVHRLAVQLANIREKRMDLTRQETALADRLIAAMHAEEISQYGPVEGIVAEIKKPSDKEKVSVRLAEKDE